jgi:hypothetical protein
MRILALVRAAFTASVCAALSACSQAQLLSAPDLRTSSLQAMPSTPIAEFDTSPRQTLAGKILAAIALERVTGLKPDPAAFSDLE